jgi:hypothetical protein
MRINRRRLEETSLEAVASLAPTAISAAAIAGAIIKTIATYLIGFAPDASAGPVESIRLA